MTNKYPDPTPEMLSGNALFDAIWSAIKSWDISRHNDGLYSGPTGNDARHIYDSIIASSSRCTHQEIALKFWADPTQEWREQQRGYDDWSSWISGLEELPDFDKNFNYEIRPCAAKRPKRMRYRGTLTFPAPETEVPKIGTRYYVINMVSKVANFGGSWDGFKCELDWLNTGCVHLSETAAQEHAAALAELKPVEVEE